MSTDVFTSPYGPGFLYNEVCFEDGVISISFPNVDIIVFLPLSTTFPASSAALSAPLAAPSSPFSGFPHIFH